MGLLRSSTDYYKLKESHGDVLFAVMCGTASLALLRKQLELSAEWNTSVGILVLEDAPGFQASALSAHFSKVYRAACIGLLVMYIEATAIWNMSIVISVLEERHGPKALELATDLIRRDEQCLVPLMAVLFICGSWCRLIMCLKSTRSNRLGAVFPLVCLLHLGNVIKLMACVVCFHNRRGRAPKEVDERA
ncbi:hypothetical protein NL676_032452 [Syzygium grande]|nr:hypothetical protein NL676_032452 [Syzygium grande]